MEYKKLDTKCEGVTYKRKPCDRYAVEDEDERNRMCSSHIYEYKFTKKQLQEILEGSEKYRACSKCHDWHEDTDHANCKKCIEIAIDHRKKKKGEKILCKGFMKDNNKSPCNKVPCKDNPFCKRSHQYMKDYTEYQMAHLTQCSGCKRWMWLDGAKTCTDCRDIGKKNRKNLQDKKHPCKHDKCPYDCDDDKDYCGNHIKDAKRDEIIDRGGVVCSNFDSRYCVNEVTDGKKTCLKCRGVGKKHDKKRHDEKLEKAAESRKEIDKSTIINYVKTKILKDEEESITDDFERIDEKDFVDNIDSMEIFCTQCGKTFELPYFLDKYNKLRNACMCCREKNRETDKRTNRVRQKSDKPKTRDHNSVYRQLNPNIDKEYCAKYRQKLKDSIGEEAYHKMRAEWAQTYRDTHPEIMQKIYDDKKKNPKRKHYVYQKSAKVRNLKWGLTYEECCDLFMGKCDYCGVKYIKESYLLGIDRVDNKKGYVKDNCVTCCEMCNMIKGSTNKNIFFARIGHILSNMHLIHQEYNNPRAFYNSNSMTYTELIKRCEDKNFECEISKEKFHKIKSNDCYMCSKSSDENHVNGIDRIDSTIGYTKENCLPCCSNCNYMKKNYNFDAFVWQLYDIYCYKSNIVKKLNHNTINIMCKAWIKHSKRLINI